MAKIGTAHIEIKPVIDEATLDAITERVAAAVAEGVARGMKSSVTNVYVAGDGARDAQDIAAAVARRQSFASDV